MKRVIVLVCVMLCVSLVIAQDVPTVKENSLPVMHGKYGGGDIDAKVVSGVRGTNGWQYTVELEPKTKEGSIQANFEQNLLPRAQISAFRGNQMKEAKEEILRTVGTRHSDIRSIDGEGGDTFQVFASQGAGHYKEKGAPLGEAYSVSMKDGYTIVTHYMGFNQNGHWNVDKQGSAVPTFDNKGLVEMVQTLTTQENTSGGSFVRESDGNNKDVVGNIQKLTNGKIKL